MIDDPSLRVSEVRDMLRLIAQLGRLSMMTAVWRTTLIKGLADILSMYVVGIFFVEDQGNKKTSRDLKLLEVCWAKPPVAASAAFPSQLMCHRTMRQLQTRSGSDPARFFPERTGFTDRGLVRASRSASGGRRRPVIELTFNDAHPSPLGPASVKYLFYSDGTHAGGRKPEALVTLLHRELQSLSGAPIEGFEKQDIRELLPDRQRQILEQLLSGDGEKQIARKLGLSIHTVHCYIRRLYRRLNVSSRSELFRACYVPAKATHFPALPPAPRSLSE
ncbi:MAG: response regulator transcription factor [Phycisphaerae bacterium]